MSPGGFTLERAGLDALSAALQRLEEGFADLPAIGRCQQCHRRAECLVRAAALFDQHSEPNRLLADGFAG